MHSGEALRFCLCVTARLDADQGRILANLRDLTQILFRISLVFRDEFGSRSRGVQVGYEQDVADKEKGQTVTSSSEGSL